MKNLKSLLALALFVIISNVGFALPPYFYTNIAINTLGQLIPSTTLNVEISIYQDNSLVYKELHNGITSSQFSFFSVEVGTGVPQAPFTSADYTALTATVTVKTQARIDIGGGTWVSLGAVYNTSIMNKGFTGNPAEIDLPAGMILVGDASNNASAVTLSNDASINSTGALTISNNAITTSKIADGNVTYSKIQSASNPNLMLISNSANNWIETPVSTVGVNLLNIANGNANQYLISNGDGTVQWSDFLSPSWGLTGNSGTIDGTNYIGTTDNVALNFKVNNQKSGRIGTDGDKSVFLGYLAGANDDLSNNQNVFVGYQAGYSNTTGYFNTANGTYALYSNTTGIHNTANGTNALWSNTTGYENTANGHQSLCWNTTGNYNTANGSFALFKNTTGFSNTANGHQSLYSNTTGFSNTAYGYQSLYSNTTGSENTANGSYALWSNTTGYENTANGFLALFNNTTGHNNTANGGAALYSNTTGSNITANGYQSLYSNTTGNNNTANGTAALFNNTTGYANTANGASALYFHATGNNNVALGYNAGYGALGVNFNQCTFVGSDSYPTTSRTNVTMLGYGITDAQCTGDNQVILGNTFVTQIRAAVTSITAYSDGRYKTNIENNVHGLDFVMKLKPITYSTDPRKLHKIWGTADSVIEKMDVSDAMSKRYIGFIAQDVEQAAKETGFAFPGIDIPKNEKEAYSLRYVDFIMPMVKSIQEQQTIINQLQSENQALKEQLNLQQTQMATMMQEIEKIKQEMASKEKDSNNNEEFFGEKK